MMLIPFFVKRNSTNFLKSELIKIQLSMNMTTLGIFFISLYRMFNLQDGQVQFNGSFGSV